MAYNNLTFSINMENLFYCVKHSFKDFLTILINFYQDLIFWTAFGVLGQWAGAIATFWAVFTALQLNRLSLQPKIKQIIEHCAQVISGKALLALSWEIVNTGIRPVKLVSAGVIIKETGKQTIFPKLHNLQ